MKYFYSTLAALPMLLATALPAFSQTDLSALELTIAARLPGVTVDHIDPSPVDGVYEVGIDGKDIVYVSADGKYLFSGALLDLTTRENLTEHALSGQRKKILEGVSEDSMIVYEPDGAVKHTITAFTDIDCPYCRKMHREVAMMNRMGIRVRYLFFPRAGLNSLSYKKAVSVWCADDRRSALTNAKAGATPPERNCDNPVSGHMTLADRLGLRATPYMITETGRAIAGYVPAPELLETLEADRRAARR